MNNQKKLTILALSLNLINLLILMPLFSYFMFMFGFSNLPSGLADFIRPIFISFWIIGPLISFGGVILGFIGINPKSNREIKFTKISLISGAVVTSFVLIMTIFTLISI